MCAVRVRVAAAAAKGEESVRENESPDRVSRAIDACAAGRLEGLEHLYEAYRSPVFRTCLRLLGDAPSAEDAAQEVFLRVFERIGTFDRRAAFSTWLYRLTVNHCLNLLERAQRRATLPMEDVPEPHDPAREPESACLRAEGETLLLRALERLPTDHRTMLVLREIEELSYREIADILEVPVGTVMSRLCRAREALRRIWIGDPPGLLSRKAEDSAGATGSRQERT